MNFHAGEFAWDNAPRSGRSVEADSGQIKTLKTINIIPQWEMVDSQNIQVSNVISEMKNVSCILQKKTIQTFWPVQ